MEIHKELNNSIKYYFLLNKFIDLSLKYFDKSIFQNKKNFSITLSNILSCWTFSQYLIKYDGLFPIYNNFKIVIDIFKDLNYNQDINIKLIFLELEFKFFYNNIKNNQYILPNQKINIYSKNVKYGNKFYISYNCNYFYEKNDLKYFNINNNLNKLKILRINYNKLKKFYTGNYKLFDFYIWILLLRYNIINSNNHQLGILPKIIYKLKKDFNLNHELFASSINSTLNAYCSIFNDIEKYFGSQGNFFNFNIISGFYTFNPPYQIDIIEKGINKIFISLDNVNNIGFFITIPIWDNEGKSNFNLNEKIKYNDFEIIYKIKKSKYLKLKLEIPKEKFSYLDHNNYNVKNITIQNTYVFVLANYEDNFEKIKEYDFFNII